MSLITGTQTIGQGHETTFPQILADRLGVPNELIRLRQGDTDLIPTGGGHGSSRATYMGGTAIWRASDDDHRQRARASPRRHWKPRKRIYGLRMVISSSRAPTCRCRCSMWRPGRAMRATPLDTYHAWTREHMTFPNGTHVVEVEIDRETGCVALVRHTAVDDYGVLVNPMIAAGQAHGAIAQGVGQALLEHAVYDPETGQPIAGSFMDYALPRADDLPPFDLSFNATRCTTNPLGRERLRRGGRRRRVPSNRQCDPRCIGAVGRQGVRWTRDAVADLAGDASLRMKPLALDPCRCILTPRHPLSLRGAQRRSNLVPVPAVLAGDCFVAALLAMTG